MTWQVCSFENLYFLFFWLVSTSMSSSRGRFPHVRTTPGSRQSAAVAGPVAEILHSHRQIPAHGSQTSTRIAAFHIFSSMTSNIYCISNIMKYNNQHFDQKRSFYRHVWCKYCKKLIVWVSRYSPTILFSNILELQVNAFQEGQLSGDTCFFVSLVWLKSKTKAN